MFSTIVFACTISYIGYTFYELYNLVHPTIVFEPNEPHIEPMWLQDEPLKLSCYLSPDKKWKASHFYDKKVTFIGEWHGLAFNWDENNERVRNTTIDAKSAIASLSNEDFTQRKIFWNRLRNNNTYYLHVHVTHEKASPNPKDSKYNRVRTIHQVTPLVKYGPRANLKNATKLLGQYFPALKDDPLPQVIDPLNETYTGNDPALVNSVVSFWIPEISIHLVTDWRHYPKFHVPHMVYPSLKLQQKGSQLFYMPILYVDSSGLTSDKLIPLNRSTISLPLEIKYMPMSFTRWQLLLLFENVLMQQKQLGLEESDLDELRHMVTSTNPVLLAVTMIVSIIHLAIDALAFKNDISFWKENKSLTGISIRTMLINFVCQVIVFLYLYHMKTTLLIVAPSFVGLLIELWKIFKATGPKLQRAPNIPFYRLQFERLNNEATSKTTSLMDSIAIHHMGYILYPLILGYSLFSLVYQNHSSWYGWFLSSSTGIVYTFGFIMMTPQLYINYKLKSVAHLPWKVLIYRAMNTFIDDLFAFVIHMPMMHRISCFRDDIIFVIYVYQRWIYPTDPNRRHDREENEHKTDNSKKNN